MLSKEEAVSAANAFLQDVYAKEPMTIVVLPELAEDHGWSWTVVFDSQEYLSTGDAGRRPISRLVVVPKDGSPVCFVPTPYSYAQAQEFMRTGRRPEPWGAR